MIREWRFVSLFQYELYITKYQYIEINKKQKNSTFQKFNVPLFLYLNNYHLFSSLISTHGTITSKKLFDRYNFTRISRLKNGR